MQMTLYWHSMLTHSALALLNISALLFIVEAFVKKIPLQKELVTTARWNLCIGAAITAVAIIRLYCRRYYTPFLLPGTAVLLVIALIPLAWKARQRWGYKPFAFGFIGGAIILSGQFWLQNQLLYYAGIAVLLAASIWNIWPKKSCNQCNVDGIKL